MNPNTALAAFLIVACAFGLVATAVGLVTWLLYKLEPSR
jgi:hypothetical protein